LEWAPRTIRPKIGRLLDRYLVPIGDPRVQVPSTLCEAPDPFTLISGLALDNSVGPAPHLRGGQRYARERLARFVTSHLPSYEVDRNRAEIDGSSRMSPYLHFGQIAPLEVALTALRALSDEEHAAARASFLNELVVQRELTINFALRQPGYDMYDGAVPDWGKRTLAKHAGDLRPERYSRAELEEGRTHDPLWNAAQRQMVHEGYMPNRLRMYWAKQVLFWTGAPEEAYATVVALNDRYFVDGRDAAGYAGIAWSIGGRHDRPFPPERPIAGLVRPMGARRPGDHRALRGSSRRIGETATLLTRPDSSCG
jgi:deoxyribodipyrimidine photo-lyase